MKNCHRCAQEFPLSKEYFGRRPGSLDGFEGVCRPCKRAARNLRNSKKRATINKQQQVRRATVSSEKSELNRARAAEWYTNNTERAKASVRLRTAAAKKQMLAAYGGKCACCGEVEPHFLTIDHINGGGTEHRKSIGGAGTAVMFDLQRRGWPKDGYRLLCYNCNCGRERNGGICPHEHARKKIECTEPRPGDQPSPSPLFDMLEVAL